MLGARIVFGSRRARTIRLYLILSVLAVALGCRSPKPPAPEPTGPSFTNEQRSQAMISIHAWARWPDGNFNGAPILPLNVAVEIVAHDKGPGSDWRRRRAVAKLAGYSFNGVAFSPAAKTAIARLGVDSDTLLDKLRGAIAAGPLPPQRDVEITVLNLDMLATMTPTCKANVPTPVVGGVGNGPQSSWAFDIKVPRRFDDVARALDPQSWAKCSTFFRDSYFVTTPASCCDPSAQDPSCTTTMGANGRPVPGTALPIGKPHDYLPLYERLCVSNDCDQCGKWPNCQVNFENILCIKTSYQPSVFLSCLTPLADRFDVDYRLGAWLKGELLAVPGKMVITDQGTLSTTRLAGGPTTGDWSTVHVEKQLSLQGSFDNGAARTYFTAMVDELSNQSIDHACCDVDKTCWISW